MESTIHSQNDKLHTKAMRCGPDIVLPDAYLKQDLTIHECQAGYSTLAAKRAIVTSSRVTLSGSFELQIGENRLPVFLKEMKYAGLLWGRYCWEVDFSEYTTPGTYRLWVHAGSGLETSVEIKIRDSLHLELSEKAAKHFHRKRCGVLCHTHDGWIRSTLQDDFGKRIKHINATGGWHDAHDDNKWVFMSWAGIYSLCRLWENLKPSWRCGNEPLPFPLAEAWWEVEWLLRMQKSDGSFFYGVFDFKKRWNYLTNQWTFSPWAYDGCHTYDTLADDERWILDCWEPGYANAIFGLQGLAPSTPQMYFAQTAASMAYFARLVKAFDESISERAFEAVEKTLAWLKANPPPDYQHLTTLSATASIHLELSLAGYGDKHMTQAETLIKEVLGLQQLDGSFSAEANLPCLETDPAHGDDRVHIDTPFAYILPLLHYVENHRSGGLLSRVTSSLRSFFNSLKSVITQSGPYGQMPEYCFDRMPDPIPHSAAGLNCWFLATGYLCAYGSRLLEDQELQKIASSQVQFVLGANPGAMCYMAGIGRRRICKHALFVHADGRDIFGGISVGIFSGSSPDYGAVIPNLKGLRIGLSEVGSYDAACEEVWLNPTAWFLCVNSELALAYEATDSR